MIENKEPLVSIVIPFYNFKDWLIEAVQSVLNQTYTNYEIIIVNDGSNIEIEDIKLLSDKIEIINQNNKGAAGARNTGMKCSRGQYIAFLDSDDFWHPEKIDRQLKFMMLNEYKWSHHAFELVDKYSKSMNKLIQPKNHGFVLKDLFVSFKGQTSTFMLETKIIRENNIEFPLDFKYGQDIEFFKKIAMKYPLGYLDKNLSSFRIRGNNAGYSAKVQLLSKANVWNIIKGDITIKNQLNNHIIWSYKCCNNIYKLLKKLNLHNSELVCKISYLIPYMILRYERRNI